MIRLLYFHQVKLHEGWLNTIQFLHSSVNSSFSLVIRIENVFHNFLRNPNARINDFYYQIPIRFETIFIKFYFFWILLFFLFKKLINFWRLLNIRLLTWFTNLFLLSNTLAFKICFHFLRTIGRISWIYRVFCYLFHFICF